MVEIYKGAAPNDKTGTPARQAAQIINDNFAYLDNKITRKDGILVSTGFTVLDNDITYNAFWQWIIDTVDYTNPVDVVINFPFATTGNSRLDLVALTTSNTFIRIAGTESDSNPISPPLPENMLQVGFVLVADVAVGSPTPPIIGSEFIKKKEFDGYNYPSLTGTDAIAELPTNGQNILILTNPSLVSVLGLAKTNLLSNPTAEYPYAGKDYYVKNHTGYDVTLKHNGATGVPFNFAGGVDIVIPDKAFISFKNNNLLEFVEVFRSWVDLSDYYTKTEVDSKNTELAYACSDESSSLTTGTVITFRMPFAMTLTSVRASVNTAPTVSSLIVDVKESGVSIFSTLLSIDATEKTSTTASVPVVISDVDLADDAEMTISITQIGSSVAGAGLKILFTGKKV